MASAKPKPNKLIGQLKSELKSEGFFGEDDESVETAANLPELYTFTGFFGDVVQNPATGRPWQVMYLDMQLRNWLLVENGGIIHRGSIDDDNVPYKERNVVWVTGDTAVGIGSGSQSLEAQFLTGDFTRAADFRSSPSGGTLAAATGVFCEAESIGCCQPSTRPRPRPPR